MLGVNDKIAGVQGERIDALAGAAGWDGLALPRPRSGPTGQVGFGDECQAQSLGDEAVPRTGLSDSDDAVAADGPV